MSFFTELKRRNVIRMGMAYALIAWVLLQAADFGFDLVGAPEWVVRALFVLALIGLPAALVFAWVFELTPEGIRLEKEITPDQSISAHTARKMDRSIMLFLGLAVVVLLAKLYAGQPQEAPAPASEAAVTDLAPALPEALPAKASVAVLPFVNMSNDPDNEYFSDGLTETLLHMLAQLPELKVAARTSSFAFKDKDASIGEIATALGVAHVLEGSVQKAGDRIRVTAQLIRADDGSHVWSQNYTEPLEDIFGIQDTIASQVADALGASLLAAGPNGLQSVETKNLSAYEQYLRGLEQQAIGSFASLNKAETHFQQALVADSAFTDARMALVRNYMYKNLNGMINRETLHQVAWPLVRSIQREHPDNRLAQAMGNLLDGRFSLGVSAHAQAVENVKRAHAVLAYIPTDTLLREMTASGYEFVNDDPQTALELLQAGLLIDPLDAGLHIQIGNMLTRLGRFDEARAQLMRAIELQPESPRAYGHLDSLERAEGNLPAALQWLLIAMEKDPLDHELPFELAIDLYDLDLLEDAEPWFQRVQSLAPGSALARALDVQRAMQRGDTGYAIEAAQAAITDQIDVRRGAFFRVLFYYTDMMMTAGRTEEAYQFLLQVRPEIEDFSTRPTDNQERQMQLFALALMSGFASFETRLDAWNLYKAAAEDEGWGDFEEGNRLRTWDYLMTGDVQAAAEHHVKHRMNSTVAQSPGRHRLYLKDLNGPMLNDPDVTAALSERTREVERVREEVRSMLQQPEWSP